MKQFISIDPIKIDDLPPLEIEDSFLSLTEIATSITENITTFLKVALTKDHDSFVKFNYNNRNLCLLVLSKKNNKYYQELYYADYKIFLFDTDVYEEIESFKISKLFFELNGFLTGVEILKGDIIKCFNNESNNNIEIPENILLSENTVEIKWEKTKHV